GGLSRPSPGLKCGIALAFTGCRQSWPTTCIQPLLKADWEWSKLTPPHCLAHTAACSIYSLSWADGSRIIFWAPKEHSSQEQACWSLGTCLCRSFLDMQVSSRVFSPSRQALDYSRLRPSPSCAPFLNLIPGHVLLVFKSFTAGSISAACVVLCSPAGWPSATPIAWDSWLRAHS